MQGEFPNTIGRYQIEKRLGSGATGQVFLARDPELDRLVAIKILRDSQFNESEREVFYQRFRNEARAAAKLKHPHIVEVYDVGQDEGVGAFVVFEYVPGKTLHQKLREEGPLNLQQASRLAYETAQALDTAHAAGIIHRDIKPDNLLITEENTIKLADFGIARIPTETITKEGQFIGTPMYAAPETIEEGRYGIASDTYSFAAILYEAITAKRLFPHDHGLALARKILNEKPLAPSKVNPKADIPLAVDRAILEGLNKAPGDRPKSCIALARNFVQACEAPRPRKHLVIWSSLGKWEKATLLIFVGALVLAGYQWWSVPYDPDPAKEEVIATPTELNEAETDTSSLEALVNDAGGKNELLFQELRQRYPRLERMSAHEREEAAKDELATAKEALNADQLFVAQSALLRASLLDEGNQDVEQLLNDVNAQLQSPSR